MSATGVLEAAKAFKETSFVVSDLLVSFVVIGVQNL